MTWLKILKPSLTRKVTLGTDPGPRPGREGGGHPAEEGEAEKYVSPDPEAPRPDFHRAGRVPRGQQALPTGTLSLVSSPLPYSTRPPLALGPPR